MARAPDLHKWRRGYPAYFFILSSIMATENRSESTACAQQTNSQVQNGTAGNNEQQNGQPQQQQQQGSIWKGLLFRMFIFWMISNLFRGRQQSSNTNTVASTNMFKTDQKIVSLSYMFLQRWLLGFLFEKICWFVWSVVFIGEFLWTSYYRPAFSSQNLQLTDQKKTPLSYLFKRVNVVHNRSVIKNWAETQYLRMFSRYYTLFVIWRFVT